MFNNRERDVTRTQYGIVLRHSSNQDDDNTVNYQSVSSSTRREDPDYTLAKHLIEYMEKSKEFQTAVRNVLQESEHKDRAQREEKKENEETKRISEKQRRLQEEVVRVREISTQIKRNYGKKRRERKEEGTEDS